MKGSFTIVLFIVFILAIGCASGPEHFTFTAVEKQTLTERSELRNAAPNRLPNPIQNKIDRVTLRNDVEKKIEMIDDESKTSFQRLYSISDKLAWANIFLFIGGGGGGLVTIVSSFIPEDTLPKSVGGISGIISVVCVFLPKVIGLDQAVLQSDYDKYRKYIKMLNYWKSIFEQYKIKLNSPNTTEEDLNKISISIGDAQAQIDATNPLLN